MADALPPFGQAAAGAAGSAVSNSLVYPLDVVACRLQVRPKAKNQDSSVLTAMRTILKEEGFMSFYVGIWSDTVATVISNFLYFYAYSFLRSKATSAKSRRNKTTLEKTHLSAAEELIIGAAAGIWSRFFTTPIGNITVRKQTAIAEAAQDVPVKQKSGNTEKSPLRRAEAQVKKATTELSTNPLEEKSDVERAETQQMLKSAMPTVREIYEDIMQEKGPTGFWSGYKSALILTWNPSISYYLFELFKRIAVPKKSAEKPTDLQNFVLSAAAKSIATTITYPLILTKSRMQAKSDNKAYRSILQLLRKVKDQEGISGFYRGLGAQVAKGALSTGITMMVKARMEILIVIIYRIITRKKGVLDPPVTSPRSLRDIE